MAAGDDTHHVMAGLVPAIPILKSMALPTIEITGTRPVMTEEGTTISEVPAYGSCGFFVGPLSCRPIWLRSASCGKVDPVFCIKRCAT
jgi:hypothetical protein